MFYIQGHTFKVTHVTSNILDCTYEATYVMLIQTGHTYEVKHVKCDKDVKSDKDVKCDTRDLPMRSYTQRSKQ